jgi:hypothetical protein
MVIHAGVLHGGELLVAFADASCAIYSAHLLRSMLPMTDRFVDEEFAALQQAFDSSKRPVPPA